MMKFDGAKLTSEGRTITLSADRHNLTRAEHTCPNCRAKHQGYTLSFKQGGTRRWSQPDAAGTQETKPSPRNKKR